MKPLTSQHIFIENVSPMVDEGLFPAKAIVGQTCRVEADVFRDGHDVIRASILWRTESDKKFSHARMSSLGNDRWAGEFFIGAETTYVFTIEAWTDYYASWLADFEKRVNAGMKAPSEILEGLHRLEHELPNVKGRAKSLLEKSILQINQCQDHEKAVFKIASHPPLVQLMTNAQDKKDLSRFPKELRIRPDRPRAVFGTWYELFVRSQSPEKGRSGTFRDTINRLDDIKKMGFDVVYLTPIHPIGRTARKGPNNKLKAGPDDPGSPWAIGNENGGHTAVEPSLGTIADFDALVKAAQKKGMEIALDFAIQCSPDHPWVKDHPEWFYRRPDGTIKYAENPPKKYEDIYPVNFDCENRGKLYDELKNILIYWIGHGVKIFRVDNPHTKALRFWEWCINEIQKDHPDVLFLAEAFTRPKIMKALGKMGFSQSYTYFTWRNHKQDIMEYLTELTTSGMEQYYRPNFFVNTPDILHEVLQKGGKPAFKMRLVLAATLSPTYGIYSGFEFIENQPREAGSEEYLNSEKYEIRFRDWNQPGNIKDFIARINAIRRDNPALQTLTNLKFFWTNNDNILFYYKSTPDKSNQILVAVNLDPFNPHHCSSWISLEDLQLGPNDVFQVRDLITGTPYTWQHHNFIRLDPLIEPVHIMRVET